MSINVEYVLSYKLLDYLASYMYRLFAQYLLFGVASELELAVPSQHSRLFATIKLGHYVTALCLVKLLKFDRDLHPLTQIDYYKWN